MTIYVVLTYDEGGGPTLSLITSDMNHAIQHANDYYESSDYEWKDIFHDALVLTWVLGESRESHDVDVIHSANPNAWKWGDDDKEVQR